MNQKTAKKLRRASRATTIPGKPFDKGRFRRLKKDFNQIPRPQRQAFVAALGRFAEDVRSQQEVASETPQESPANS